jgi:hypothetical protein
VTEGAEKDEEIAVQQQSVISAPPFALRQDPFVADALTRWQPADERVARGPALTGLLWHREGFAVPDFPDDLPLAVDLLPASDTTAARQDRLPACFGGQGVPDL